MPPLPSASSALLLTFYVILLVGGTALLLFLFLFFSPRGTPEMEAAVLAHRRQTRGLLHRAEVTTMLGLLLISATLYLIADGGVSSLLRGQPALPLTSGSAFVGGIIALVASAVGSLLSTITASRTSQALRSSLPLALRMTALGAATIGFLVSAIALTQITGGLLGMTLEWRLSIAQTHAVLLAFLLGLSAVTLMLRLEGGIAREAAALNAAPGRPHRDSDRSLLLTLERSGSALGGGGSVVSDLLESAVVALVGAVVIGMLAFHGGLALGAMLFPPLFLSGSLIACLLGFLSLRFSLTDPSPEVGARQSLRRLVLVSTIFILLLTFVLTNLLFPLEQRAPFFLSTVSGILLATVLDLLAEAGSSPLSAPIRRTATSQSAGAGAALLSQLAHGHLSTALPVLLMSLTFGLAFNLGHLYGIALAALGTVSGLGVSLGFPSFLTTATLSVGITSAAPVPARVRTRARTLQSIAATTLAVSQSNASAATLFSTLTLLATFTLLAGTRAAALLTPSLLAGLLLGAAFPYVFSSVTMRSVISTTRQMHTALKSQRGVLASALPSHVFLLAGITILTPLLVGSILGREGTGGLLLGALISGTLLRLSLANASHAWEATRRSIEEGYASSKGIDRASHDLLTALGNPFAAASGHALSSALKLMPIVAILAIGWCGGAGLLG